jgi:DNA-binding transcriptional LysR family regulator
MRWDYNKLKIFCHVVEEQSFSRVAHTIGRTQSAVSQSMASLEQELGENLFERHKGGVYPTAKGRLLFEKISLQLNSLDLAIGDVLKSEAHQNTHLRLGVSAELFEFFVAPRISNFLKNHRNFYLETVLDTDANLEKAMMLGHLDVAIITQFQNRDFFEVKEFVNFEEHLVGSPHYLFDKNIKCFEHIFDLKLYDYTLDFVCIGTWLRKNDKSLVSRLKNITPHQVIQNHRIKGLLLKSEGVAMMPDFLIPNSGLTKVFPKSRPTKVSVDLALRKQRTLNRLQNAFINSLLTKGQSF